MNKKVIEIIADVLRIGVSEINNESGMNTLDKWDSLQHLNIILAVEEAFNVSFTPEEITSVNSVEKIVEAIQRHSPSVV